MSITTSDLSEFGSGELAKAGQLLSLYSVSDLHLTGTHIVYNKNSGFVFLSDDDFNVYMVKDNKLEEWLYCGECGHEDYESEWYGVHSFDEALEDCMCSKVEESLDYEDCTCGVFSTYREDDEQDSDIKRECPNCHERELVHE